MGLKITSHVPQFKTLLLKASREGILRVTTQLKTDMVVAVNVSNQGTYKRRTRDTSARHGGPRGSGYTVYDHPSSPGEPPRARTGFGKQNVIQELDTEGDNTIGRVGVRANAIYMYYLDQGTDRVAARPFMLRTFNDNRDKYARLALLGMRSGT